MHNHKKWTVAFLSFGFLVLIFDSKTALIGALSGVDICLKTVIPSLFPFFVLSILLTRTLSGADLKPLKIIGKYLNLPKGAESVLIPAFLGGYPAGAQSIVSACDENLLNRSNAQKMLALFNNVGPAFLFGMITPVFSDIRTVCILWVIQIASSVILIICMRFPDDSCVIQQEKRATEPDLMLSSIKAMAIVCGWVILFRMILCFLQRWFLWLFPIEIQILITGLLELSNGCLMLSHINSIPLRFVFASGMLAFGGLCVILQTKSVAGPLFNREYIKGKLLQTGISVLFAVLYAYPYLGIPVAFVIIMLLLLSRIRKNSSIPEPHVV